jgi:hypothetical protein
VITVTYAIILAVIGLTIGLKMEGAEESAPS